MNNLPDVLANRYVAMRHGTSGANEEGIIASNPAIGTSHYGLTRAGKEEVRVAVERARNKQMLDPSTLIVASDFVRTKETAEIAADVLGIPQTRIILTSKLRERSFGTLDGGSTTQYETVWEKDSADASHKEWSVESIDEVRGRALSLIADLERKYATTTILLVSHGDTLQILQTAFQNVHAGQHRTLPHHDYERGERTG